MCQNSFLERSEQIERCLEQGMPEKIIKSVVYTLKKRTKQTEIKPPKDIKNIEEEKNHVKVLNANEFLNVNEGKAFELSESKLQTNLIESKEEPVVPNPNSSMLGIPRMCGRFRQQTLSSKLKKPTEIQNGNHDIAMNGKIENPHSDILAVGTAYTKLFFKKISKTVEDFKNSKINILLTQTSQPAHFVAICVLSAVLLTIWPDLIDSATTTTATTATLKTGMNAKRNGNALIAIAYLATFSTHFGSQIWMTFVSGLSLYFSLPRHIFGQCQQILFPKYFTLNAVLSIIQLIIFVKCYLQTWTLPILIQFMLLAINPAIELIVRLYLAPPMLRLMHEKYKIEDAIGSGHEIGSIVQGDLTQCPHYLRIHKAFRRLHMMVAMGNMFVLLATFVHLYFLATKIQINLS